MTNAEKFEKTFGIYATELWAMPENEFLKWLNSLHDVNATEQAGKWIPCSERLPSENGNYLVTAIWNGKPIVDMDYFQFGCQWDDYKDTVVAWMPLPEPSCHTFGYTSPENG